MPRPWSRTVTTQPSLPRSGRDLDARRAVAVELHRVADQVLQHAAQLARVAVDLGQRADLERRARRLQAGAQIGGHLAHDVVEGHAVALQLARARVGQDAVDQLARALGAVAQQPQDLRRRRLVGAALEQRDEVRDPRDGLAKVVGDHVGVAAQLGLHAPLRGDVGEKDDQPVAEPRGALDERAEHVAVAERRVIGDLLDPRLAGVAHPHVRVERPAAAHLRERLEKRVAIAHRRGQTELAHDRWVAIAELEVGDRTLLVAQGPEDADRFRKAVEQGTEARGALLAEQCRELRVVSPGLRFGH